MPNNIVDNLEQCGQQNIVQCCFHQARTGLFFAVYGCFPPLCTALMGGIVNGKLEYMLLEIWMCYG